jgi:glycosyltransferase involved in cell wall biosynthesis
MNKLSVNIRPEARMPGTPECDVAIVVPVYRNAATLSELASRVARSLNEMGRTHRLVFVVDASPDDSWRVVERLARADDRVSGVLLGSRHGQHRALMVGLKQVRAKWIAIMDADLQDPPELLPELLREGERTALTVFARRDGVYQRRDRMLTSRLFKGLLGALTGLPADAGTYFIVPGHVAERMRHARIKHVQLVVMAHAFSSGWRGVRYARSVRCQGESAYSALGRLQSAVRGLACAWECRSLSSSERPEPGALLEIIVAKVNL